MSTVKEREREREREYTRITLEVVIIWTYCEFIFIKYHRSSHFTSAEQKKREKEYTRITLEVVIIWTCCEFIFIKYHRSSHFTSAELRVYLVTKFHLMWIISGILIMNKICMYGNK